MKPIPIKYIKERIEALEYCKSHPEEKGKELVNDLWCTARINAMNELIQYWKEDMEEYENNNNERL